MNIKQLKNLLFKKTGKELFKKLGNKHPDFKKYALICHTDKNIGNEDEASECFKLLQEKANESTSGIVINAGKLSYEVEREIFASGDISTVYRTTDKNHLLKITNSDKYLKYMDNEASCLEEIRPDIKKKPAVCEFFPAIQNKFFIRERNRPKRKVHVFNYDSDFVSIKQIRKVHDSLDGRNFGWIFKRLLFSLDIVHQAGYIHGAVTPDHFLVDKINHTGRIIDFIHCVKIGEKVSAKVSKSAFLPNEILNNKPVSVETDIYMAGKLAIYLLGGNPSSNLLPSTVPSRIRGFIRSITIENQKARPNDAFELHENFSELLLRLYGPPKYVKLTGV